MIKKIKDILRPSPYDSILELKDKLNEVIDELEDVKNRCRDNPQWLIIYQII